MSNTSRGDQNGFRSIGPVSRYRPAVFIVAGVSFSIGVLAYISIQEAMAGALAATVALGGLVIALVVVLYLLFRAQRRAEYTNRVATLDRIDELGRRIQSAPASHAYQLVVDGARTLVDADLSSLVVLRPGSLYEIESTVHDGDLDTDQERLASLALALLGSLGHSRTMKVNQLDDSPGAGQAQIGPLMAVRISSGSDALGLLFLARRPGSRTFTAEEEALLRQLSHHTARAIESAQHGHEQDEKEQQLDRAGRLKGVFLANMSHELRTPLAAIIGFSDLMLEGADGDLTPEMREDIAQINSSGKSLLQLINDILDLSKIEAGRMILEVAPVDLSSVLHEVLASLRPLAQSRSLNLRAELSEDLPSILGDPMRIRQILSNLISNAVKFTHDGGVTINCQARGEMVEVSIVDTGIGIAPEAMDKIFLEFTQADDGSKRRFGGTGLGLAITQKLVRMHGGELGVESSLGSGSRFWFTMPRNVTATPETIEPALLRDNGRERKRRWVSQTRDLILAIDDEPAALTLIARRLEEAGFETATATNARDAIRMAREFHPAAITLDVMMPDTDGWKVLAALKNDPLTADIPVLVVTVVDGHERAIELGAASYLTKPVTKQDLKITMDGLLPNLSGADILTVDDEAPARELIRRSLELIGANVRSVVSGAEALDEVARKVPDAIFVDLMMPEMSGFELIARLRTRPALSGVPIIVLSARELTDEDVAALGANIDRFIRKSEVRPGDLGATIRQAIDHKRQRPAAEPASVPD